MQRELRVSTFGVRARVAVRILLYLVARLCVGFVGPVTFCIFCC